LKHATPRRAAPVLFGLLLLASLPVTGAYATRAASPPSAPPSDSQPQPNGQQTVGKAQVVRTIPSLSDLANSQSASAPSPAAPSNTANSPEGVQAPYHRGSAPQAGSGAALAPKAPALAVPNVAPLAVSGTDAVRSFAGLDAYEERRVAAGGNQFTFTPPDQGMCVGNGFVM
jgi:hypothetical protein